MEIENLSPGGFAANCYLLTSGNDAVLIDPTAPVAAVRAALQKKNATLRAILLTHGHFDHLLTAEKLRDAFRVPLLVHKEDAEMLDNGEKNASASFLYQSVCCSPADQTFVGGNTLSFGAITLSVMHTPGHTKGSSVFLTEGIAFTGDTLFAEGYGRTDLWGGSTSALLSSLKALSRLDPTTRIYPGHGEHTALRYAISFL